jgi:hypothetical protein
MLLVGTLTFSKIISQCPNGASSYPNTVNGLTIFTNGYTPSLKFPNRKEMKEKN